MNWLLLIVMILIHSQIRRERVRVCGHIFVWKFCCLFGPRLPDLLRCILCWYILIQSNVSAYNTLLHTSCFQICDPILFQYKTLFLTFVMWNCPQFWSQSDNYILCIYIPCDGQMDCRYITTSLPWQVHQQTQQDVTHSVLRLTMNVIKQEGILSLNHGLSAAVLRQLTYSTTRFAVYEVSICFLLPRYLLCWMMVTMHAFFNRDFSMVHVSHLSSGLHCPWLI